VLHIVHGLILHYTRGFDPATQRSLDHARAMAEERGDPRQLALVIGANWMGAYIRGESRGGGSTPDVREAVTLRDAMAGAIAVSPRPAVMFARQSALAAPMSQT
jgi:hypothetical protein